jgi:hypothetical protein
MNETQIIFLIGNAKIERQSDSHARADAFGTIVGGHRINSVKYGESGKKSLELDGEFIGDKELARKVWDAMESRYEKTKDMKKCAKTAEREFYRLECGVLKRYGLFQR